MSNQMPIYSHIVPKSQYRNPTKGSKNAASKERPTNLSRTDFDPLNYNHGGQFHLLNPLESKYEKMGDKKRQKDDTTRSRKVSSKPESNEGKVEAYLRQNQVSIRQQQHRHSAVRQAEHRVNLRSLPLNDVVTRNHDRTPTDRHRGFPERERDGNRERDHRRERDKDRDRERDLEFDGTPLSPVARADRGDRADRADRGDRPDRADRADRGVRKSSSSHKVTEPGIATDKRRFFCREWAFQKIAHCLEQRPVSKTCGALILGDAGSGKTALCQELSEPGQGPQARQQRALNRRLLARHFLQGHTETGLRPSEFVRSLAMQLLSQSSRHARPSDASPRMDRHGDGHRDDRRNSEEERLAHRFKDLSADDGEDSCKPLLADSEDQRTDDEDGGGGGGGARSLRGEPAGGGAGAAQGDELPQILPRASIATTNPFLSDCDRSPDLKIYENHENVFLRNLSQRQSQRQSQSQEARDSRLLRQSSEPLCEKRTGALQKSLSTEQKADSNSENERSKSESSPPKQSRIPVASFRYPRRSDVRHTGPARDGDQPGDGTGGRPEDGPGDEGKEDKDAGTEERTALEDEPPDYQNVLKVAEPPEGPPPEEGPPPIPSLPVSPRTLIANAYYEKLLSEPEIQQALLPQNLEKNPDECFKKALLFPLLEIDPPKQCLFLLVDAIDEGSLTGKPSKDDKQESTEPSRTVAELLARQLHLLPNWLLLVCTARRHCRQLGKMFTGFRKITLDELHRAHVSADVQRYVLARLDTEPRLRARVSSDAAAAAAAAAALDHLRIKSDGCLLYLEKVLDGVADGFIALREIREIPGTLNGLYLWLAQRLLHGRRFTKVRLLLDVLLAARCGVTEELLYKCLLTKEYSVTREDLRRRLHLLRRILVMERATGYLSIFHHSFALWLLDVKHCTRRYLCSVAEGDAALAMYYTLEAKRLNAIEIHNYVYHMTNLEQHLTSQKKSKSDPTEPLDTHTLVLLWVLDSGCDVDAALRREGEPWARPGHALGALGALGATVDDSGQADTETEIQQPALQSLMPSLAGPPPRWPGWPRWPRDARVLRALAELARHSRAGPATAEDAIAEEDLEMEEATEEPTGEDEVEPELLDPSVVFELATKGDDEALIALLKRHPQLAQAVDGSGGAAALLAAGADADAADADGWSPLRAAAWAGHTEVVEVLLEHGCQVDCVDADNRTALRAAAWSGHVACVARLLAAGAGPGRPDAEGRTPLIAAAYMGHVDIVRLLLDAGADLDHADEDGRTALAVASLCATGAACAALLLERGASPHIADRDHATPLLVAAFEGHTEICELLLEAEADMEATDALGRTALWAAAAAGHAGPARLLLFWGATVDNMDAEGRTVLSAAAAQGNVEVVRQLLDRGLDEHHRDNSGWTPLHYAAFEGHMEVCEALLEAGARVDEADNDGKGPLMLAAQEGHHRLLQLLADDWRAPVHQRAHDGNTALRLAAREGHFEAVRALAERGADVDALDADRRSTLYVLALDNRLAMARYLISECGASVDSRDAEGRTPLHVSAWQGHHDMVNLLIKVGGAQVDGRDRCGRTALHAAAWRGRGAVLAALLRAGADPAAVCAQGATPLGIAAQEGHEQCVLLLLQHGADPLQPDHCGRTPAKVAWRAGHAGICRLLERCAAPSAPAPAALAPAPAALLEEPLADKPLTRTSPDCKRRSVHSSNSTKSSSATAGSGRLHEPAFDDTREKPNRANLSLSFAQQVARCGRGRREEREVPIPEHHVMEKDSKLRSYMANERDADIRGYRCERDSRRDARHGCERDGDTSPLYASPPRSPVSPLCSPSAPPSVTAGSQPASLASAAPAATDQHFNRDTHMRIILGRDCKPQPDRSESEGRKGGRSAYTRLVGSLGRARGRIFKKQPKNKRNGIVTNPAMRLVANVRNGLDSAAANIRRTGVALAASASSNNPAVKSNAFQWRRETEL